VVELRDVARALGSELERARAEQRRPHWERVALRWRVGKHGAAELLGRASEVCELTWRGDGALLASGGTTTS
jgi:hypothetical protein